jgi:hypothetical protein
MFGLHDYASELFPPLPRQVRRLLRLCDHVFDMKLPDQENHRLRLQCVACKRQTAGWDMGRLEPPRLSGSPVARRLERRRAMRMTRAAQ